VTDGYLYYPWVLSYGVAILILGLIYFKFFWRMEKKIFFAFMGAALLYLSGAIGLDILGGKESSLHGTTTILYSVYYTLEESFEMFGVIYLISILLKLLSSYTLSLDNVKETLR